MTSVPLPFYIRATVMLLGLALLLAFLYIGREILIPIAFAILLSVLLYPVHRFLENRLRFPRLLAITITLVITTLFLTLIIFFIGFQLSNFIDDLPRIRTSVVAAYRVFQTWITSAFGISLQQQSRWLSGLASGGMEMVSLTASAALDIGIAATLIPIYVFLFLLYKELLMEFIVKVFGGTDKSRMTEILHGTRFILQRYVVGLLIETGIVAVLNCAVLLLLGIEYAILFGILAAVLNLIPYIGIFIGCLLPAAMALITKDTLWYPAGVVLTFAVIQFIDNNLIVPNVVGSHISLNSIAAVIAVLVGAQLWGISGMFLSLPFVAVLKVIFDHVPSLEPWGKVLGDKQPALQRRA
ncbi:MAG: AI-2E family transporter [Rhizobacter sp.]|nr:AI-2E family transporter [Chlorobiales bacterium]